MQVMTHGEKLSTEDRINGRLKICEYLGAQETTGAYDIPCLTKQGILPEEFDPVTAFASLKRNRFIYRALIQSDRTHLPKRKPKALGSPICLMGHVLHWIFLCLVGPFLLKMGAYCEGPWAKLGFPHLLIGTGYCKPLNVKLPP